MWSWDSIRSEFYGVKELTYLNTASTGLMPERSIKEWKDHIETRRLGGINWPDWEKKLIEYKEKIGKLINAEPAEIAFCHNTSYGINIIAHGIKWRPGDEILLNDLEFPANYFPWIHIAHKYGLKIIMVKNKDGIIDADEYAKKITNKTRIIAVSWVEFSNGFVHDLKRLSEIAHNNGAYLFVDGIQGVGALSIDVKSEDIDFMACGGHKWLISPTGTGFLYVRDNLIEELELSFIGWRGEQNFTDFTQREFKPAREARRFEIGTLNFSGIHASVESINLLLEISINEIEKRNLQLIQYLKSKLENLGVNISTPETLKSPILSFKVHNGEKIYKELRKRKIIIAFRLGNIRVSPHFYNNEEDIDTLIKTLKELI
ncbi:MAG: aminotransferase class V-fold PLP-dependent enzyme [Candidatus Njordarchaeia archaeon]|nr:aminotransferase class V-fold PLP-dependent enzyme [Candidatus Korarchaeota archaeon]